jgi:hypothetical protein
LKKDYKTPYPVSRIWSVIQVKNTQLKLRAFPDLCKNDLLPVIFAGNGNSYTTSTQSDMCIYTHIPHTIEALVGQNK